MRSRLSIVCVMLSFALMGVLAPVPTFAQPPVSLSVTPHNSSLPAKTAQQFNAVVTFSDGSLRDVTQFVTWTSSATRFATISSQAGSEGLVTGVLPGTTIISARYLGVIVGSTALTITNAGLVSFEIVPASAATGVGFKIPFAAAGVFADGSTRDVTNLVNWSASNAAILTVSNTGATKGLVTARAPGSASVVGRITGYPNASAPVTVFPAALVSISVQPSNPSTPLGTQLQFSASGTFSNGSVADVSSSVSWTSQNTNVATVNGATGLAVTRSPGATSIRAKSGVIVGSTVLTVDSVLLRLRVVPASTAIPVGTTQQFQVFGDYLNGTSLDLTTAAFWTSSIASVAAVSNAPGSNGRATGASDGTTNIRAAYAGATSAPAVLTVSAPSLLSLAVAPSNPAVALGTTQQFSATGTYTDGSTHDLTASVTWTSLNPAVADVNASGLASTLSVGVAEIAATSGSVSGSAMLTVNPAALVSITVTPPLPSIPLGLQQQFQAVGTFTDGSTQDLTSLVSWSSAATNVATINLQGLVSSLSTGTTAIGASAGAISGTTTLTVTDAQLASIAIAPANNSIALGTSQAFSATGTFTDGSTLDVTGTATWSSSDAGIATVSNAPGTTGVASSIATGSASISAAVGSVVGSTTLNVTAAQLVSIAVTPAIPSIPLGTSLQFTATGTYSDGTIQDVTATVHWTSSVGGVATISNSSATAGLASSLAQGDTTIGAALDGISGSTTLTVRAASLIGITVTPPEASIALGTEQQFHASGSYTDGSTLDVTNTVTWTSSNAAVAAINAGGLATTISTGTITVTAMHELIAGTASLTVTPATLMFIDISPTDPLIPLGTTQQFTATGTYTDGSTQDITATVHWTSTDAGVATISVDTGSQGLATSTGVGATTITATSGPISASTTLTVTTAQLVSIALAPLDPTIPLGASQQFSAIGTYTDDTTTDVTTTVTWTTSLAPVAIISNTLGSNGLATSAGVGSATITATSGSVSAFTTLTVGQAQLVSIAVTPANSSIALGLSQLFVATGTYTDGSTQDITNNVVWASSVAGVATIDAAGLAHSVGQGPTTITATSDSISGSATLTVTAAVLSSIAVTPEGPSVVAGLTRQFAATATYSDGTTQTITGSVAWASALPGVATINAGGLATGVAPGITSISATMGTVSGSTSLIVTAAELASLVVTPTSATIPQGSTQRFTATGTFTNGSVQNLSNSVAWTSSLTTVASVNATGLASGVGLGTTTITATLGSFAPTATLTVEIPVTPGGQPRFVYVANSGGNSVSGYIIDQVTGALNAVPGAAFATGGSNPQSVAVDPSGRFVYTANISSNSVSAFSISSTTGALTVIAGSPFAAGSSPNAVTVDPTGSFAYVVNQGTGTVSAYTVDVSTGALTPVAGAAAATGSSPTSITVDPTGKFVYVTNQSSQNISAFVINAASGALTPVAGSPFAAGGFSPQGIAMEPQGKFLYVANSSSNAVAAHAINPTTGALITIASYAAGSNPWSIAPDPSGRFLYVANLSTNNVSSFTINPSTGTLTALGTPVAAGSSPRSLTVDPSGRFLYVANQGSNNVSSYAINATTGTLTGGSSSPFASGNSPASVATSGTAAPLSATLQSLQIVPDNPTIVSLTTNQTLQLTLVGSYSDGSTHFLTASATWTSNASGVVTVGNVGSTKGRVTTTGFGARQITATVGSVSTTTTVTVAQPTLVSIAVTPASSTIALGTAVQFAVTGTYSDGSTLNHTGTATWTSADSGVATISATGLATGLAAGTTTITAESAGEMNTATLTVMAASANLPRFLYVGNRNANTISSYGIDLAGGALAQGPGSPVSSSSVRGIATEPSGRFVFAGTDSNFVRVFQANATTGSLTQVGDFGTGGSQGYALTVDATGRFLYVANRGTHTVSVLSIDAEAGGLTPIAGSPFPVGSSTCPTSLAIDASGQFLYVGIECKAELWGYAIDPDSGALAPLSGAPFATSGQTVPGVVIQPGAARLYATSNSNRMVGYNIGPTGSLTPITGSPFLLGGSCQYGLAAEPTGRFLYATDQCVSNVRGYAINATTGALTAMAGSPFAMGSVSFGAAADPSGRFLYVTESSTSRVAAFGIDSSTGALSAVAGSPFASGAGPWGLAISRTPVVPTATLLSLAITPVNPTLFTTTIAGQSLQFVARGTYSDGTTRFLTTSATWTSSVPAVAGISNVLTTKGRATLAGFGSTTIIAAVGLVSTTTTFTVAAPTLVSIAVTPASPTIALGTALQFTATGTYSDGSTLNITNTVMWTSADPGVATISTTGLATSVAAGPTTITAVGLVNGSSTLTVVAASANLPRFLYVGNRNANTTSSYGIDLAGGALAQGPGSPVSSSTVRGIATEPSGRFVFAGTDSNFVRVFRTNPTTGSLTTPVGDFVTGGSQGYALTVDATGRFLYVANRGTHTVSVLSIDAEAGGLTPIAGSPFPVGSSTCPTSLAIDASGQFLYVGIECKAELWGYAIDPDSGALAPLSGAPFATSGQTVPGVVIQPGAARLYATSNSNRMVGYNIGPTGSLTPITGSPFLLGGSCQYGLAAEPTGRFLYATDQCVSNVRGYAINATTGALTAMAGSPFAMGSVSFGAAADPSGRFLYVTESSTSRVAAFGIDSSTGALSAVAGSPFASGAGPWGLAISRTPVVPTATLLSLAITPVNPTLFTTTIAGQSLQFVARGTYSDGTTRFLTTSATWTSSVPAVAGISNSLTTKGRATVASFGSTTIEASFGGHTATTTFTVAAATLVSIAVTPASPTIALGTALQFTATGTYSDGTTLNITNTVMWSSADPGVATISATGLATSVAPGTTTITATLGTTAGTASLGVQ